MLNATVPLKKEVRQYNMELNALSLMEYFAATLGSLIVLALIFCLCCFCMKLSDLKMKSYIMDLARKRGVKVDLDQIDQDQIDQERNCQSPLANENCTIYVPGVAIIL